MVYEKKILTWSVVLTVVTIVIDFITDLYLFKNSSLANPNFNLTLGIEELIYRILILVLIITFIYIVINFLAKNNSKNTLTINQETFDKIFNFNPEAILITRDPDSVVLQINNTFENIFKYSRTDILQKTTLDINLWKDIEKRDEFYKTLSLNGEISNFVAEVVDAQQNSLYISFSATSIIYDKQKSWIVYGRNITERILAEMSLKKAYDEMESLVAKRTAELEQMNIELDLTNKSILRENNEKKRAEFALKESEEKYRSLLHQLPVGVYRTSIDGKFLHASPALANILECDSMEELMNSSVSDFYESDDLRLQSLNRIKNENVYQDELQLHTKKGRRIWVRDYGRIVSDSAGQIIFLDGILEDISSRKEIEEALYWQSIINSTLAELSKTIISTPDLEIAAVSILESAINLADSRFGLIAVIDQDRNEFNIIALHNDCQFSFDASKVHYFSLKEVGLLRWISENSNSLMLNFDELLIDTNFLYDETQKVNHFLSCPAIVNEKLVGVIALAETVEEYTIQDLEIVEQLAALLAMAIQRSKADEETKYALEREQELSNLKSRFISMISHEYRTPLQVILMSTQLLMDYKHKLNEEDKDKYFERIKKSIGTMNNLLDDIISLNKFNLEKYELKENEIDLVRFCKNLADELKISAGRKCSIETEFSENLPNMKIDEILLNDILSNLLTNSIKYSYENTSIKLIVSAEQDHIEFRIEDKGIGIPESELESLFIPFFRGYNVGTVQGTGLGLAIVKNTVDHLGGLITCQSLEGEGTTFTVKIPLEIN